MAFEKFKGKQEDCKEKQRVKSVWKLRRKLYSFEWRISGNEFSLEKIGNVGHD